MGLFIIGRMMVVFFWLIIMFIFLILGGNWLLCLYDLKCLNFFIFMLFWLVVDLVYLVKFLVCFFVESFF